MGGIDESLANASIGTIIGTGLALGIVHVLTGPDHLSALIVLSAGSSWRSCLLGMRWGVGHSTSLILITVIFLSVDRSFDIDKMGTYCDFVVGILMIALGLWGIRCYWKARKEYKQKTMMTDLQLLQQQQQHQAMPATPNDGAPFHDETLHAHDLEADAQYPHQLHGHGHGHSHGGAFLFRKQSFDESLVTRKCCFGLCNMPSADIKNPHTTHLTAFAYGIAHGLAGTGGVLGVLPAVVLNNWGRSFAYLLSFCAASIFIMGVFAALYGELTGRIVRQSEKLEYRVGIFSSSISLVVGVTWVILVATGSLDAVFG